MPNHALLNPVDHQHLRVDTRRDAALGDDVANALTFPGEFRNVQAHYPIVFQKAADGALQPVALFGFRDNLFLEAGRWDATYLPVAIERQPFLIGRDGGGLHVHIDLDHPRVGAHGEALFGAQGGPTAYLDRVVGLLRALHDGLQSVPAYVEALTAHGLIESFVLDVTLADGSTSRLAGFYTIDEDRLRALDADAVAALHRAGHLEPTYMVLASLSRLRDLIERMNRRHAG